MFTRSIDSGCAPRNTLEPTTGTLLTQLLLDNNRFTGAITPVFALAQLSVLNVDNNALTGTLAGVGALTNVDTLILSRNQLTGDFVGHGLRTLIKTTKLDVSRNALHGDLPMCS